MNTNASRILVAGGIMLSGAMLTMALSSCLQISMPSKTAAMPVVEPVPTLASAGLESGRYACSRTTTPIQLDGSLDEAAWRQAEVVKPFWRLFDATGMQLATDQTQVRLLWDDQYLYIGVEMDDQDLTATFVKHDEKLWTDGDVFEFFMKPSEDSYWYYEFHVNPLNATLDLGFPRRNSTGWDLMAAFESGMKTAVKNNGTINDSRDVDRGWSAEMAIPFAAIEASGKVAPRPGDTWQFAPCRYNYSVHLPVEMISGCELTSAARYLKTCGFHNYENYLTLVFE